MSGTDYDVLSARVKFDHVESLCHCLGPTFFFICVANKIP